MVSVRPFLHQLSKAALRQEVVNDRLCPYATGWSLWSFTFLDIKEFKIYYAGSSYQVKAVLAAKATGVHMCRRDSRFLLAVDYAEKTLRAIGESGILKPLVKVCLL